MTNADLVWHLVELLLHKDENQVALDQAQNTKKSDDHKQNEA